MGAFSASTTASSRTTLVAELRKRGDQSQFERLGLHTNVARSRYETFTNGLLLGNSSVWIPGGVSTVSCGGMPHSAGRVTIPTSEFQRLGYDVGTVRQHFAPGTFHISAIY